MNLAHNEARSCPVPPGLALFSLEAESRPFPLHYEGQVKLSSHPPAGLLSSQAAPHLPSAWPDGEHHAGPGAWIGTNIVRPGIVRPGTAHLVYWGKSLCTTTLLHLMKLT